MLTLDFETSPDDPTEPVRWWYVAEMTRSEDGPVFEPSVRIDEAEHGQLLRAIGDLYGLAGHNALALLEQNLLQVVALLQSSAAAVANDRATSDHRFQLQIALANWLGSWRLFLDHAKKVIPDNFGGRACPELDEWRFRTNFEFDYNDAYPFIEGLRDFTIHAGLVPISYAGTHDGAHASLSPHDLLERWGGWKSAARQFLQGQPDEIDLLSVLDRAMQSIHRLDEYLYSLARPRLAECLLLLLEAAERLGGGPPRQLIVVAAERSAGRHCHRIREVPTTLLRRVGARHQATSSEWHPGALEIRVDAKQAAALGPGDRFRINGGHYVRVVGLKVSSESGEVSRVLSVVPWRQIDTP